MKPHSKLFIYIFDFFCKYDELLILYIYFNNFYICIIIDFIIYDITSSTP